MSIESYCDLRVYQRAFDAAMRIFELSKEWPKEERYALTDQIRRSSRSVCQSIAEAWSKRRYEAHFVSKLTDAEGESAETHVWLDFALKCGYLPKDVYQKLYSDYRRISGGLVKMMRYPEKWCGPAKLRELPAEYNLDS